MQTVRVSLQSFGALGKRIRRTSFILLGLGLLLPALAPALAFADSPAITEYHVPSSGAQVFGITSGSDGALWFTEANANKIGRITTSGSVTEYPVLTAGSHPSRITAGPDGSLWFNEPNTNKIGRITTSGAVTEYSIPAHGDDYPFGITAGPDGALWFTEAHVGIIGRITTSGVITEYPLPNPSAGPLGITAGPDGALWFTENVGHMGIGRITTSGVITEYSVPTQNGYLYEITPGPDGALWFTEANANKIGRITTSGSVTEYPLSSASAGAYDITTGSDGTMWFAESNTNKIGHITTAGVITEYQAPTASSVPLGIGPGPDGAIWFTETGANQIGRISIRPADTTPPSVTGTPASQPNANGWYNNDVTIYWSATDPDSTATTPVPTVVSTEGAHQTVTSGQSCDPSGNCAIGTYSDVSIDKTSPAISYSVAPVVDSDGYNTGNVKVTFTCTDSTGGSGITSCTSPVTVDNEGVGHTVDGTATDGAGNSTIVHANASLLVQAINAGGSGTGNYTADTDFSGGQAYSSSATVDTGNVTVMPAPQGVYQSVRYGNMTYVLPNLTPNASYTLRLHFNELYWGTNGNGGDGSRVFNVAVNGQPALTNFDIYKTAGGANKALVEELPVTADANGNITVQFTNVTDNAVVSGMELYQGTLAAEAPAPTSPTVTSARINAGGNDTGNFVADTDFSGGQTYGSTANVDTSDATNPAPQAIYQSVRYGNFTYTVPNLTPNTDFLVRLHFNEPYWGMNGNGGDGSRVFNVSINGQPALTNFDVYKTAGGANKALVEDFVVTSDDHGKITMQFTNVTDNAMVSGIEIEQPSIPTPTYYTANDGTNFSRSSTPFASGVATQGVNSNGSIRLNVNNAPGYADSGFVLYEGTLGNLPNFTTLGKDGAYSLNLWFDTNNNNEFFAWNNNVLTELDGDTYGLATGLPSGVIRVNGSTQLFLMSDGQNHSLTDLRNGAVSGINANTKVAVWIGVNTSGGSAGATITSVDGL